MDTKHLTKLTTPTPSDHKEKETTPIFDNEHHFASEDEVEEKTPSPKIEKRVMRECGSSAGAINSNRSEDDMFSDAVKEFSDTKICPGVTFEVKKVEVDAADLFEFPILHSQNDDKLHDSDKIHSVPFVKEDKFIDKMCEVSCNKDQVEDVHEVSVPSDIPLVDKAETLIQDFKDQKTKHARSRSIVDMFEAKTVHERVQESQTSESADNLSEPEGSHDERSVKSLGELVNTDQKMAESVVFNSKDNVKVGTFKTPVDEGSGKLLTGQDCGVDVSVDSSSNSLEGNWGSVSGVSDAFGKSSRFGKADAFEGPSFADSKEEIVEQKASEIKTNEEAIAKVTNWSTSEAKSSPNPKHLSKLIKKDEDADKITSESEKSNLTQETPKVHNEASSVTDSGKSKQLENKTKEIPSWLRFLCCSTSIRR